MTRRHIAPPNTHKTKVPSIQQQKCYVHRIGQVESDFQQCWKAVYPIVTCSPHPPIKDPDSGMGWLSFGCGGFWDLMESLSREYLHLVTIEILCVRVREIDKCIRCGWVFGQLWNSRYSEFPECRMLHTHTFKHIDSFFSPYPWVGGGLQEQRDLPWYSKSWR